jgi:hypothetical protein
MSDRPDDLRPLEPEAATDEEEDWVAEIKRLRAARGEALAERLAAEAEEEPPA